MPLVRPGQKLTVFDKIHIFFSTAQSVAGIFAVVFFVIRGGIRYGPRLFALTSRLVGPYAAQIGVGVTVIALGVGAHKFKQRKQDWYGMVDVAFGSIGGLSICFTLSPGQTILSQWVGLTGCAYVIARGLNNISEAKKVDMEEPIRTVALASQGEQ
jgi:uncharacterized membrane protein HdeD (DUF308 family)